MGKAAPARTVALRVLGEVRRRDGRAREILRSDAQVTGLDVRDRALVMRLVLGVVAFFACIAVTLLIGRLGTEEKDD